MVIIKRFKLFLDDSRKFPSAGYECCRSSKVAILLLSIMDFEFITLDYSLGNGDTGMNVLLWMKENNVFVPHINIHSNHIFGRRRMQEFCEENFPDSRITMNMLPK